MPFRFEWVVHTGQTDFSGRIYTPELVDCLARGLEKMMRSIGYGPRPAWADGVVYPVVHVEADYVSQIGLNDTVVVSLDPAVGTTSVEVTAEGRREGERVFTGEIVAVFVDEASSDPVPVPEAVRDGLADLEAG